MFIFWSWLPLQLVEAHGFQNSLLKLMFFCDFGKFDEAHVNEALVLAAYKAHASAFV